MPNIFLLRPGDKPLEMTESPYDSKDVPQQLLASFTAEAPGEFEWYVRVGDCRE